MEATVTVTSTNTSSSSSSSIINSSSSDSNDAVSTSALGSGAVTVSRAATQRLMSDYKEMMIEPPEGCSAAPASDSNLFVWNASIVGPEETPFEGFVDLFHLNGIIFLLT